jgi:hypothetical protein
VGVFNLFGGAINWMIKRQVVVVLSTTEVEYMVATHAIKEAVWLQRLCSSIGLVLLTPKHVGGGGGSLIGDPLWQKDGKKWSKNPLTLSLGCNVHSLSSGQNWVSRIRAPRSMGKVGFWSPLAFLPLRRMGVVGK